MMDESEAITKASFSENSGRKKTKKMKSFDFCKLKTSPSKKTINLNMGETTEQKPNESTFETAIDVIKDLALYPPPMDVYVPKVTAAHDTVSFGLNMYFKKAHKFSMDPK
jgi:hypothetical protein